MFPDGGPSPDFPKSIGVDIQTVFPYRRICVFRVPPVIVGAKGARRNLSRLSILAPPE